MLKMKHSDHLKAWMILVILLCGSMSRAVDLGITTPGVQAYPDGALTRIGATVLMEESPLSIVLLDLPHGHVYVGTKYGVSPSLIVKFSIGSPSSPPLRLSYLQLVDETAPLGCGVIDPSGGYAYFGTRSSPARILKVALTPGSDPAQVISSLTLNSGEDELISAIIDPSAGYAWFAAGTSPTKIIKVALGSGDSPPVRIGATSLESGVTNTFYADIDVDSGYGYFASDTYPGSLSKVFLGAGSDPPQYIGKLDFPINPGCSGMIIDPINNYAYAATDNCYERLLKIALGEGSSVPTVVASSLISGECYMDAPTVDATAGFSYWGSNPSYPTHLAKIALGAGTASPYRVSYLSLLEEESHAQGAALDADGDRLYMGTGYYSNTRLVKFNVSGGTPARIGCAAGLGAIDRSKLFAVDANEGYAYAINTNISFEHRVAKMRLGIPGTLPYRLGDMTITSNNDYLNPNFLIDAEHNYGYLLSSISDIMLITKLRLGTDEALPSEIGQASFPEDAYLYCSAIDSSSSYGYLCASPTPIHLTKFLLGSGDALPTRIGQAAFDSADSFPRCIALDPTGGLAYVGTSSSPARIVKFDISGSIAPTRLGHVSLNSDEGTIVGLVHDAVDECLWVGTDTSPARVIKFDSSGVLPVRIGSITLTDFLKARMGTLDRSLGVIFFYNSESIIPAKIAKIAIGGASDPPVHLATYTFPSDEYGFYAAGYDSVNRCLYPVVHDFPSSIIALSTSLRGSIQATRIILPELAIGDSISFYSHTADGHVRLGVYDNGDPRRLIWQSSETTNTITGDWLTIPLASGTPSSAALAPGTYWLAWQIDTDSSVPSYVAGASGDGFETRNVFGPYPSELSPGRLVTTSKRWSQYLSYSPGDYLTVTSAHGAPIPPTGTTVIYSGTVVNASVESSVAESPGTLCICIGWSGTGDVPTSGTSNSLSYLSTQDSSITWLWKTQYELSVASAHGTPTPPVGSAYYDVGALSLSAPAIVSGGTGVQYVCTGWIGSGDVPTSGTDNTVEIVLSQPSSINWVWKTQCELSVTSAHGTPTPPVGSAYYDAGALSLSAPAIVSGGSGVQYVCTGWIGSGDVPISGTGNTVEIVLSQPSSINWTWKTQYELSVTSAHGTPTPPVGSAYYDAGALSLSAPAIVSGASGEQYVCTGWIGSGDVPISGTDNTVEIVLSQPSSINWAWKTQYELSTSVSPQDTGYVTLLDGITPAAGYYDASSAVILRAVPAFGYQFVGWSGDLTGTVNPQQMTMNAPASVVAIFQQESSVPDWPEIRGD